MTYILLTEKNWHDQLFHFLSSRKGEHWIRIKSKEEFSAVNLQKISPDKIFIPHWSSIIPAEIYTQFECIVFHMTDLPYGRGGSPLQNLIARGHKTTIISALNVTGGIDTGDIYLKAPLSLEGTAQEIFERSSAVIKDMIVEIIEKDPNPVPQQGEVVEFKRRKPEDGNLDKADTLEKAYDYIRMLDCEGYPSAFIESKHFKFEFYKASIKDNTVIANVRITKK